HTTRARRPRLNVPSSSSLSSKRDRKSTRLNSSHGSTSYAVFCMKKKKRDRKSTRLNSSHGSNSYVVFCMKKKNLVPNLRDGPSALYRLDLLANVDADPVEDR